jgi:hypothetical protein
MKIQVSQDDPWETQDLQLSEFHQLTPTKYIGHMCFRGCLPMAAEIHLSDPLPIDVIERDFFDWWPEAEDMEKLSFSFTFRDADGQELVLRNEEIELFAASLLHCASWAQALHEESEVVAMQLYPDWVIEMCQLTPGPILDGLIERFKDPNA